MFQLNGVTSKVKVSAQKRNLQCIERMRSNGDDLHTNTEHTFVSVVDLSESEKVQALKHVSTVANLLLGDEE